MSDEAPVKRWTAKRESAVVIDIFKGKTTPVEVARQHDLTVAEVERWVVRMRRNFLKGALGEAINSILAAAGFNIRWLMHWLLVFLRRILSAFLRLLNQGGYDVCSNLKPAAA